MSGPDQSLVKTGRVGLAGSGRITLAVAGNARAQLLNPAGSGRDLFVFSMVCFSTVTGWVTLYRNPTVGVPTTLRPMNNAALGGSAPVAQLRADQNTTTALSGGTDLGLVFGVPPNGRATIELPPLVIPPGDALGVNIPFSTSGDVAFAFSWWEEGVE